jgi:hypothetical protein
MPVKADDQGEGIGRLLNALASYLGFRERKKGLFALEMGEDLTAYIDFRQTWRGWRYAFQGGKPVPRGEVDGVEPLRRFKEMRDDLIRAADGHGRRAPGLVAPSAVIDEILASAEALEDLRARLLGDEDYIYLDGEGRPTVKEKASRWRIRKRGWRKLAYACGLDFVILGKDRRVAADEEGEYFIWTYRVLVADPRSGRFVEAEGACSSRDPLLASGKVSEAYVMHRAQTAAINRGISDLLGLDIVEGSG